jgi:DNA-binding beta-propeller fold protein YncE
MIAKRARAGMTLGAAALLASLVFCSLGRTQARAQEPMKPSLEGGLGPIHMADLRGKIVLLDFWTYCCINCHHVLPDLARLEAKYPNELVVIGVHTAKFSAERETENIRKKVAEFRIKHPVVNDADQVIWQRFGVQSWPTLVLIDATGKYIGFVSGEGNYDVLDKVIGELAEKHKKAGELSETKLVFQPESDRPAGGPLLYPGKVLADEPGKRLFVADTGHNRVVVLNLEGKAIATYGTGEEGLSDGKSGEAKFNRPQGMALVGETLYVADTENHAIRAIDLKTKSVKTVAGNGEQSNRRDGGGPGTSTGLNSPWDLIQIPGTDTLAVAMAGPHQIWKYDIKAGEVSVWAGNGRENIADGPVESAEFAQPSGLATDGKSIFVADSEVSGVRSIGLTGETKDKVDRIVGTGLFGFGDVDGIGKEVRLQHCLGVAFADGKLYIADTYNNKIKVSDPKTKSVQTFVGAVKPGLSDTPPRFDEPGGLSVGGKTLYVADTNNHRIRAIDLATKEVTTLALSGLEPPKLKPRKPSFANPTEATLPLTKLKPGKSVKVSITLPIPEGFKLGPEAPIVYLAETPETEDALKGDVTTAGGRIEPAKSEFTVTLPLTEEREAGSKLTLKLSVGALVCKQGGSEGLCIPKSYVWTVPVEFAEDGEDTVEIAPTK